MSNRVLNELVLKTNQANQETKAAIDEFANTIERAWFCIYSDIKSDDPDSYELNICFDTYWNPPLELYKEIEAWMGKHPESALKAEATWVDEGDDFDNRYQWSFDGNKYRVNETNLTLSKEQVAEMERWQLTREAVEKSIQKLKKERDGLDQTIKALEGFVLRGHSIQLFDNYELSELFDT